MENIRTVSSLKDAIQKLEAKQQTELNELKEQFHHSYESLKPTNLFNNALRELISAPAIGKDLIDSAMALLSGYFANKIAVGSSESPFRKILGALFQFVVANFVSKHTEEIKVIAQFILQQFSKKDRVDSME